MGYDLNVPRNFTEKERVREVTAVFLLGDLLLFLHNTKQPYPHCGQASPLLPPKIPSHPNRSQYSHYAGMGKTEGGICIANNLFWLLFRTPTVLLKKTSVEYDRCTLLQTEDHKLNARNLFYEDIRFHTFISFF